MGSARRGRRPRRRFLEDDVRVGATGAEAGDARAARPVRLPGRKARVDEERAVLEPRLRIRLLVEQARRELAVNQRLHRLDEARDARGLAGVPDVGLDRADRAVALSL